MADRQVRLLTPVYLPGGDAPLPSGSVVALPAATAANLIAQEAAEDAAPPARPNPTAEES